MNDMNAQNKKIKLRWLLPAALCLTALLCFFIWHLRFRYLYNEPRYQRIVSDNGVWDLTDFDFENNFARANGQVEYIPGALFTPEEFEARNGEARIGYIEEHPYYTARLRILVPDGGVYMLSSPSADYSARVYINGDLRQTVGAPGVDAESETPGYAYLYYETRPRDGVIELVIQFSNFVHRDNGNPAGWVIGRPEIIERHIALETDLTALNMGVLFALFLSHGLLFLISRRYKANLYFALLCLVWCLRAGVTHPKLFIAWFPELPWEAAFRLEYITVPLAALLTLLIIRQEFKSVFPNLFIRVFYCLFGACALACLIVPTLPLSYCMVGFEAAYLSVVVVIMTLLFAKLPRMAKAGEIPPDYRISLTVLVLFMFAAVHDAFFLLQRHFPIRKRIHSP